jgi:hypothetical protein
MEYIAYEGKCFTIEWYFDVKVTVKRMITMNRLMKMNVSNC